MEDSFKRLEEIHVANQITGDNFRFTVLADRLVRMEYAADGQFVDGPTQMVVDRTGFITPDYTVLRDEGGYAIQIESEYWHLYYRGGEFDAGSLFIDTKYNYQGAYSRWHFGEPASGNMRGTARTLDDVDGACHLDEGVVSRDGFATLNDPTGTAVDVYGFAFGHDYQGAIAAFYQLTGKPPLVPRWALGNWWSRYYEYTQDEYLALMAHFDAAQIPIDVAVLDMNWHTTDIPQRFGSGWTGYTWDTNLFPDPDQLLKQLHASGRHVTLNVHPAAGVRASEAAYPSVAKRLGIDPASEQPVNFTPADPKFMAAYFEDVHHPLEARGVDFWWIDWQQGKARGKIADPLWALNQQHYEDQVQTKGQDALILSRYAGPGSHRYPVGFSGDSVVSWASLAFQPYFTATATNIGYTWWSHDIGGHTRGTYDPELALRWLQYGVFSPIMRLHSTMNPFMGKEPWRYGGTIEKVMDTWLRLRDQLLPYLESANIATHEAGVALVRPLYYAYPEDRRAYDHPNEYLFGSELIVAPITQPADAVTGMAAVNVFVPEGQWTDFFTKQTYVGPAEVTMYRREDTIPVLVRAGGIMALATDYMHAAKEIPDALRVQLYPGASRRYILDQRQGKISFDYDDAAHTVTVSATGDLPQTHLTFVALTELTVVTLPAGWIAAVETLSNYDAKADVFELLQHARIGFELKRRIWQELGDASSPLAAITTLSGVVPAAMMGPIIERLNGGLV